MNQPFDIRGLKIAVSNGFGQYNDLLGGALDRSTYQPWSDVIEQMRLTGANTVTLVVSAGVMARSTDSGFDPAASQSPDTAVIAKLAQAIQAAGMSVAINPFVTVAGVIAGDPSQAGSDRPHPIDKTGWLSNFAAAQLTWARFAQDIGAVAFVPLSDETQHLLSDDSMAAGWIGMLQDIRQVFDGVLTSNWWTPGHGDSITAIAPQIIGQLDYLGLGLFPDLSFDDDASVEELTAAYHSDGNGNDVIAFLAGLSDLYGKPIWITDKAFHSFDGASHTEGRIFDPSVPLVPDADEQGRLYESFLKAMTTESGRWLTGVSFQSFNNVVDGQAGMPRFMDGPLSESPQGKPAEAILSAWFNGLRQGPGIIRTDGFLASRLEGGYHHDQLTGGLGNDDLWGGPGDDVLVGGPSGGGMIPTYSIDVLMRGVPAGNVAPVASILNFEGVTVAKVEVTAPLFIGATQSADPATRVSFVLDDLSRFKINQLNWDFLDFSPSGNRLIQVESILVNGLSLDLAQYLTYLPPTPWVTEVGQTSSYHGGGFGIDLSSVVTQPNMTLFSDDDTLTGGPGNDLLQGGDGLDWAVYSGSHLGYTIVRTHGGFIVTDLSQREGVDRLEDIERISFADMRVALDMHANAGVTAKFLGAIFGAAAVFNTTYAGIGLGLLDGGVTPNSLMALALDTALGPSRTDDQVVQLLYRNLTGANPSAADLRFYAGLLASGQETQESLGMMAAEHPLNLAGIGMESLLQSGLNYL